MSSKATAAQIEKEENSNKCYIGETNKLKQTRMNEHKSDIKKHKESSNIAKHANEEKHAFDFNQSETLTLETDWKRRTIKESLFKYQMQDKSLNDVKFKLNIFA
jgi:hypothetical protein